jgi:GNAT superfamily N-acetyltransferase
VPVVHAPLIAADKSIGMSPAADDALVVRPYRAQDRSRVRYICGETAALGEPAGPNYDVDTIADMFTSYFTDHEPESAWVAVDARGQVVGYLIGAIDSARVTSPYWCALRSIVMRFLWLRPSTAGFWWRALYDMIRDRNAARPPIDAGRYPATAHFNMLPVARGGRIAYALFETWKKYAIARGVTGLWSESIVENLRGSRFHENVGFSPFGQPTLIPGSRTPRTGERMYCQRWLMDLRSEPQTSSLRRSARPRTL